MILGTRGLQDEARAARSGPSLLTDTGRRRPHLRVAVGHVHDAFGAGDGHLEEERLGVPTFHLRGAPTQYRDGARARARRRNVRAVGAALA